MADFLAAKGPTEIVERRWTPSSPPKTVSQSASGVTVDSAKVDGDDVLLVLSGGTAGETAAVTVTVTTNTDETLVETLYLPIIASPSQVTPTARAVVSFALRKITGTRKEPSASELNDALEHLEALVPEMRATGADIGAPFPLTADSVIYCPDWALSALRYGLRVRVMDLYGIEPSAIDYERHRRGLQLVKQKGLPAERINEFF